MAGLQIRTISEVTVREPRVQGATWWRLECPSIVKRPSQKGGSVEPRSTAIAQQPKGVGRFVDMSLFCRYPDVLWGRCSPLVLCRVEGSVLRK